MRSVLSYRKVKHIVDLYALSADHYVSLFQQFIISKDINHSSIVITFCQIVAIPCSATGEREDREAVQAIDLSGLGFRAPALVIMRLTMRLEHIE